MSKIVKTAFLILIVVSGLASGVFAQRQTGSLDGKIIEKDGSFLPGVSVTITSPALLGTRTFVTTDKGSYRFPALSPGEYSIICELSGFETIKREKIILRVGMTTTINLTMEQTAIQKEVLVTAAAPVVDVKSSQFGVSYTKELMENIPLRRNLFNVLASAPGVVAETSGGNSASLGASVLSNQISLDGLNITNPITNNPIYVPDLASIEEIEIQLGSHPADVGSVPGGYVNVVTRSGGNTFHGDGTFVYFDKSLIDSNMTKEQLDTLKISGPSFNKTEKDFSFNLGGPVIKDKLWFFISGRYAYTASVVTNFPKDTSLTKPNALVKLTYQVTKNIKLFGYYNYGVDIRPYNGATSLSTPEATLHTNMKAHVGNLQMNWIIGQNAFLDLRSVYYGFVRDYQMQPGATHPNYDRGTGISSGGYRWDELMDEKRLSFSASFTLFADNVLGGDHELKLGAETERTSFDQETHMKEPIGTYTWNGSPYYFGGNVGQFYAYGMGPTVGEGVHLFKGSGLNFYITDKWTIFNRLTLNLGLRYDSVNLGLPAQSTDLVPYWQWLDPVWFGKNDFLVANNLVKLNNITPRLGLVFDIFGNGKTVAKASYSRILEYIALSTIFSINPNTYAYRVYTWTDTNLNAVIDAGDTFVKTSEVGRSLTNPFDKIDPNLKASVWTEFIAGIDHELVPNFRIGLRYIYKKNNNIIESQEKNAANNWTAPYTVTDPGYDGIFGTGDDSKLTVWDRTSPQQPLWATNPAGAFRKYSALELEFEKRMTNNWQLLASIVYSKSTGTIGQEFAVSGNYSAAFDNPNWLVNRNGRSSLDRPLIVKLQGTYRVPYGINLSAIFMSSSGTPFGRVVSVMAPNLKAYVTVLAEPVGTRRTESWNNLDLRAEKEFSIGKFGKLGLYVDVYNALNSTALYINTALHGNIEASGSFTKSANWLTVTGARGPRYIMLGFRFRY